MKENSVYFTSDLSEKMNEIFVKRFNASDFSLNPKTKLTVLEECESVDMEKVISEVGEDVTRKVFNGRFNNEKLPYADKFFDTYISTLSLMIVPNHHNQLAEAYRVLNDGGIAGFSVWGREKNSSLFTFLPEILAEVGIPIPPPARTNFHLGVDKEALIDDVKAAGFSEAKAFYTMVNISIGGAGDYWFFVQNGQGAKDIFGNLSEEQNKKVKDTFFERFEERFGAKSTTGLSWETLIVIAKK